jgi:hypothetical protein
MRTLDRETFLSNVRSLKSQTRNWRHAEKRWSYHEQAIHHLLQSPAEPNRVLELGSLGAQIVPGSHTMDYLKRWNFKGNKPTYAHDARKIPWPVEDGAYDWFVAMRVFQHLWPVQRKALAEAMRVARNVLIVVPEQYKNGTGITREQIREWCPPSHEETVYKNTRLYVWQAP